MTINRGRTGKDPMMKTNKLRRFCLTSICVFLTSTGLAGEVGFLEEFALATDREAALGQLIPGTEDYYYYHALHHQNTGQLDKVGEVLKQWIKRYNRTPRVVEIENRQALLRYPTEPEKALDLLRQRLGLRFDHQRQLFGEKPSLPTRLDSALTSRETLTARALEKHPRTLDGFEGRALDWAVSLDLGPDRRRQLLSRLARPDYPNLPRLVVDDLNYKHSRGFGSFKIHHHLLLEQLEECLKLKPDLRHQTNFVSAYLAKLRPNPDVDWRHDRRAREAYLERLWAFVRTLNPSHNSLKVHVLYQRLLHDRALAIYDKERFLTYLQLPRNVSYVNREYLRRREHRSQAADLRADYSKWTLLSPVGNDEPLVRSFFEHFFATEESYKLYEPYINDGYLRRVFAETKVLAGIGDMEKWYSMLSPEHYQDLKERVDLDFAHTNKTLFGAEEQVGLDVHVKNVQTLIVKVFEINALNYYRANRRELDTGIDLDGLVPNEEKTYSYGEPPLRRVKRHFEFPALAKRGTYVIDFIGNGKSSRALVRKGRLRFLERISTAGHVFTILDESNRKLPGASLWIAGRQYRPDDDGAITVPFSNRPGNQPVILLHEDFASLDSFQHRSEEYRLSAGIHVAREALLERGKAKVVVRPYLTLQGIPVTLSVLEDTTLVITSIDRDGVTTTKEVKDFKLHEDSESVQEFQVPGRLTRIQFTLKAKVQNLSQNKKVELEVGESFELNRIDTTEKIAALHLSHGGGEFVLDLLGRTGEVQADRPVHLKLKHRDFRDVVEVSLQTDARGRVSLGELTDIAWVQARGPEGNQIGWYLNSVEDRHSYPRTLHGQAGETLLLPYMGIATKPLRSEFAFFEKRGNTVVNDRFAALAIADGYLEIRDLPRGDYELWLKNLERRVTVRLSAGEKRDGYVLSSHRQLELRNPAPLQIVAVEPGENTVHIRLGNRTEFTRVHVVATRYVPEYSYWIYRRLNKLPFPEPYTVTVPKAETLYVIGRDIGDEYRYILDRQRAKKYAGNMLTRPSLLLNPWAIRTTETRRQEAARGEDFERRGRGARTGRGSLAREGGAEGAAEAAGFANLDFLRQPATVLVNLEPDDKGIVTVKRADLGSHHQLHVVAVDPENTAYRQVSLPETEMEFRDLRLQDALNSERHYTEQKEVTILKKESQFVLDDITTSDFEAYDSLDKVYALFVDLSQNSTLVEFGFLLNWPEMKPQEKRETYSKYACHELNFFLFKKDPAFFKEVVRPYLENKYHKTFLDDWLLGEKLEAYLDPWAYGRLNVVERILLARRIEGEQSQTSRHVADLLELIPPDADRLAHLFRSAIKGRALDTADDFGLKKAKEEAVELKAAAKRRLLVDTPAGTRRPGTATGPAAEPATPPAPVAGAAALVVRQRGAELESRLDRKRVFDEDLLGIPLPKTAEGEDKAYFKRDDGRRKAARQLYRKLEMTKEWVENNYYQLPIERQDANLITVNAFWRDYAAHDEKVPFFSQHLAEASRNFPEMAFALAVLDLPFGAAEHQTEFKGTRFTLRAGSSLVVFHKEIKEAQAAEEKAPILVSQDYYRHGDRYRHVKGERLDKFVSDEFLVETAYGCHVVITNPTSSRQTLDVLLQVPQGAIALLNGQYTRSLHIDLEAYRTWTNDYFFYFPAAGDYPHFPVHVAKNETPIAFAPPSLLHVVEEPTKADEGSWDYVSQNGTGDQVIAFLEEHNLGRVPLERIAWRLRDKAFFRRVLPVLHRRHVYDHTLWSYGILHNDVPAIRQYLRHADGFVKQCGSAIDSRLLTIDPVERKSYQHMEYWPLVNARAHRLGPTRKILNDRFYEQYMRLMRILSCRAELDDGDLVSVTSYLLRQGRVEEALEFFSRVRPRRLASKLQYDYLAAYLSFYTENLRQARSIATAYASYPVDRWRQSFANVAAQLDEIQGKANEVVDQEDRTQTQTKLAADEPSFDFQIEGKKVLMNYQNLERCRVNYYLVDIELLFSRNPFVGQRTEQFAYIRPNATEEVKLDPEKTTHAFELPAQFQTSNLLVEILGGGKKEAKTYFSNALVVQLAENYAQAQVTHRKSGRPLPRVYLKVYARMGDGNVKFYKDGYTDLRGRFDYGSLSTNELDHVQKFAVLVLSEDHGGVVREAAPPKR